MKSFIIQTTFDKYRPKTMYVVNQNTKICYHISNQYNQKLYLKKYLQDQTYQID